MSETSDVLASEREAHDGTHTGHNREGRPVVAERRPANHLRDHLAIDAVLKWLPGFRSGYLSMISSAGQGQPGWLHPWFSFKA
jgi:hypothetical protein